MSAKRLALSSAIVLFVTGIANADTITYSTAVGLKDGAGEPLNASAKFTTVDNGNGTGTLTIVLTNLQANPTSAAQLISDIQFTLSPDALNGTGTNLTQSGSGITITGNTSGDITTGPLTVQWGYTQLTNHIDDLAAGGSSPAQTIIGAPNGSGAYSNANNSITGNHNPHIDQSATFTLVYSGMTGASTVTSATMSFGTAAGVEVHSLVPEPSRSAALLGLSAMGVIGMVVGWRRRWLGVAS
jgi:hypothetical protein